MLREQSRQNNEQMVQCLSKIDETTEGMHTDVKQTREEIKDRYDNLSGNFEETLTIWASKLGILGKFVIFKYF